MPTNTIYIDTNRFEEFAFITTKATNPTLRAEVFSDGSPVTFTADNTAKFIYYEDSESTSYTEVDGVVTASSNVIDFSFEQSDINTDGIFKATVVVYDAPQGSTIVQAYGSLELLVNPFLEL